MADVGNAQREIRRIAYRLWMEEGQPEGRDREHWERAKEIWNFRHRDDEAETSDRQMEASGSGHAAPSDATPRRRTQ
ncbi:MAG TPA: DUF2934 domain-containing protein [Bosea sp. (in: a-proteobacteria)]|jgi:hypothetical protein|uniref:DUF2934 domain-containing protein n=1 Tax=Bosea sp. (in: a-proteobacteria) TaxID=1871050 RepID=UPI002E1645C3|nr:DUF2934 domain-containing protein [Bosea sp. (in: a-proteobacteria)]